MTVDMKGRTCVITGASSGIGREAARGLLALGAEVVMLCRDAKKAGDARADIVKTAGGDADARAHVVLCELASLADIHRAADELLGRFHQIHVLVHNAGAINTERRESSDGHELTLAVNHLAPMLLTHLLRDRLVTSSPSRVITVASGAHWRGSVDFDDLQSQRNYSQYRVYADSKLMNILFARELAHRLTGTGVVSNAMHPGLVSSSFGPQQGLMRTAWKLMRPLMISSQEGADTIVWLASAPEAASVTGEYFVKRKVALSSPRSKDMDLARRLWEVSAHLCGISERPS